MCNEFISSDVSVLPTTLYMKLEPFEELNKVDGFPNWDFTLKPNSGAAPVLKSCITIRISLFSVDFALREIH